MARLTALLVQPLIQAPATMAEPSGVGARLIPDGLQEAEAPGVGAYLIPEG